jgi:hypothetical protein
MSNLGLSCSNLGRHSEALAMLESVLEFYRRVLPADHPSIGEGREWGVQLRFFTIRKLVVFIFVVRLCICVSSGLALNNISFSFERTGALPQALDAARESLRIRRATLPAAHQHVSDSEARVRRLERTGR